MVLAVIRPKQSSDQEDFRLRRLVKKLFMSSRSRLSRRIVFYVFVSVIVIETIILIPSYMKREQDLLMQLRAITSAQVEIMINITQKAAGDRELFQQMNKLNTCPNILGGALYRTDGEAVGTFGEPPELLFSKVNTGATKNLRSADGNRYDSAWQAEELNRNHVLILRQDATSVRQELFAYIFRVAGLVVIISIFVTAGAWIALDPIVVTPVLRLRGDLEAAGNAISNDRATPEFYSASIRRKDELGEVIAAFNQMYHQIHEAISDRKNAEAALHKSFKQVKAYSQALNQELERGREMQANFLPSKLPVREGWEFAAFFKPARQVSGDFYDAFELPGDSVGLVIADVCDKGVGAALFMALFRSLIRIFSGQTSLNGLSCRYTDVATANPAEDTEEVASNATHFNALKAIQLTNDYIVQNHEDLAMFATLFFGVLDPVTGDLAYINGGHDPLFILNPSGGVREHLGPTGPAVGVQPDVNLEIRQTRMNPGEILFGYTDGVTEARAEDGSFYSEKRLMAFLKTGAASTGQLLDRLSLEVENHIGGAQRFDDITMLAVRRLA